jgi:hypothetical protein
MTLFGKVIVSLVFIVIAVVCFHYVGVFMKKDSSTYSNITQENSTTRNLTEAFNSGESYECAFHFDTDMASTTGIVYIREGVLAVKSSITSAQGDLYNHVVIKDGFSYSWSSLDSNNGIKVKIPQNVESATSSDTSLSSSSVSNSLPQINYAWNNNTPQPTSCIKKEVNMSFFEIPSTMTFKELQ